MEPDLTGEHAKRKCPGDGHFQPLGMDGHGLDQFFDQHSPFLIVGVLPNPVEVECRIAQQCRSLLEGLAKSVGPLVLFKQLAVVSLDGPDLLAECPFLLSKELRTDLVVEVQLQELLPLLTEPGQRAGVGRQSRPTASSLGPSRQLGTNRLDQIVVGPQQLDPQAGSSIQTER